MVALNKSITLFHGTSKENLEKALVNGILPWNEVGQHNWDTEQDLFGFYTPIPGNVYIAKFDRAKDYALYLKENWKTKQPVVIEVLVDKSNLVSDEDAKEDNWQDSLKVNGTCAHVGFIPASKIMAVYNCA